MKLAHIDGRAHIIAEKGSIDINAASQGLLSARIDDLVGNLQALREWLATSAPKVTGPSLDVLKMDLTRLGPPVFSPSQVFAIGLNYRAHSEETQLEVPQEPMVFTKFPSSITGPGDPIVLPSPTVDWEAEMVVVIGNGGRDIAKDQALNHVAGYCVGQDISDRDLQFRSTPAQFNLGKSHRHFAPIGPWLTTTDEVDSSNLHIGCSLDAEVLQSGHTSAMIFDVATLVSYLSRICELRPGDLIFSGTPEGVGFARQPPRFLTPGAMLSTTIEHLGELANPIQ